MMRSAASRIFPLRLLGVLLPGVLLTAACEDVITLDLKGVEPRIVIEGVVTEGAGPHTVFVSMTTDFFSPELPPPINGAEVVITDDAGGSTALTQILPGVYRSDGLAGVRGRTYTLTVSSGGWEYRGTSSLLRPIRLDSLTIDEDLVILAHFTDSPDTTDFCLLRVWRDGVRDPDYMLYSDEFTDGNAIEYAVGDLSGAEKGDPPPGTEILFVVELVTIEERIYEYFSTLMEVVVTEDLNADSPTPANPNTNLSGGALGYFAAWSGSVDSLWITVPPPH